MQSTWESTRTPGDVEPRGGGSAGGVRMSSTMMSRLRTDQAEFCFVSLKK